LHIFRIGDEAHLATKELDINPLLADETGVIALDARLRIEPSEAEMAGPNPNVAIRPYPNQWERWIGTDNGYRVFVRPIKPADEHLYGAFVEKLSPEDIRFRFLTPRKEFSAGRLLRGIAREMRRLLRYYYS
jgi:acetyltransferase